MKYFNHCDYPNKTVWLNFNWSSIELQLKVEKGSWNVFQLLIKSWKPIEKFYSENVGSWKKLKRGTLSFCQLKGSWKIDLSNSVVEQELKSETDDFKDRTRFSK